MSREAKRNLRRLFKVASSYGWVGCMSILLSIGALLIPGSAAGQTFAYVSNFDGDTVSVIDTATNIVTATVAVGGAPVGVAAHPDGQSVFVTTRVGPAGTVQVIDTASNLVVATVPVGSNPYGVAVHPDGSRVYVANFSGPSVSVIDTASNTVIATIANPWAGPTGVAIHPSGDTVYVGSWYYALVLTIDTATNTAGTSWGTATNTQAVAVHPTGNHVYAANDGGPFPHHKTVTVIDIPPLPFSTTNVNLGADVNDVAVYPDGSRLYAATDPNLVNVLSSASPYAVLATVVVGVNPTGVSVHPDGSRAYVTNRGDDTVSVFDTTTNTVVATVPVGSGPFGIALSTPAPTGSPNIPFTGDCNDLDAFRDYVKGLDKTLFAPQSRRNRLARLLRATSRNCEAGDLRDTWALLNRAVLVSDGDAMPGKKDWLPDGATKTAINTFALTLRDGYATLATPLVVPTTTGVRDIRKGPLDGTGPRDVFRRPKQVEK